LVIAFLRHVERNLLLLFLIDLSPDAHPEPGEAYRLLKQELSLFSPRLFDYPRVVVGNKLDLTGTSDRLDMLRDVIAREDGEEIPVFGISAATGEGVEEVIRFLLEKVTVLAEAGENADLEEVIRPPEIEEKPLKIEKVDHIYVVSGTAVERMAAKTDFENEEALLRFQKFSRRSGLDKELKKAGLSEGDTVRIGREEFTYYED
jgi:GTPase